MKGWNTILMRINVQYVVESINPYISKTPWQEWVKTANEWNWLVGVLRLKPEHQATFKQNIGKAQQFVNSMIGHPYGFHNYLFGWIDTPEANFPSPITQQTLATVFQLVDIVKPAIAVRMWGEALNKRLGTHGLNVAQLFDAMNQRNLTFGQVISMPENDTWVYSDGLSRVCSTFVMSLYKETGVIGPDIQATEFTPRDSYSTALFDPNWKRPAACDVDDLPWCQIAGEYILHLPGYNTIDPFPGMFEKCGTQPFPFTYSPSHC
eukprot:TRINITY_DN848_c0_g1_i3.p1 TRINITY_DN848_c0_g1~~TRINITY_DN848_c0_g1_i3.p1  ORF type:complete len:264 (-),score=70.90 TRINITY_DN848_c0_g1_i3:172-963(-)